MLSFSAFVLWSSPIASNDVEVNAKVKYFKFGIGSRLTRLKIRSPIIRASKGTPTLILVRTEYAAKLPAIVKFAALKPPLGCVKARPNK